MLGLETASFEDLVDFLPPLAADTVDAAFREAMCGEEEGE